MQHAIKKIFLHPGEFSFGGAGLHVHTLLGSCVSITLWHPREKVGGMCHFTMPGHPRMRSTSGNLNGRYAEDAMLMFAREMARHGTPMGEYQAKVFGGNRLLKNVGKKVGEAIGTRNVSAAMHLLAQEKVNILAARVCEFSHQRIVFDVSTGDVWVKQHHHGKGKSAPNISGKS